MKLLLVEDSERLRRSLSDGLTKAGYAVDVAVDGEEAIEMLRSSEPELVILDLMLPKISGLDVLRWLRNEGLDVHVLILSAKDQVEDRVAGLSLGADDYLVKPFDLRELRARIQALLRRRFQVRSPAVQRGRLEFDTGSRQVRFDGQPIELTPSEFAVLETLALRPGQVFSRSHLIHALYNSEADISSNMIEVFVSQIRQKLRSAGAPSVVRTRRGLGYYFEDDVDT